MKSFKVLYKDPVVKKKVKRYLLAIFVLIFLLLFFKQMTVVLLLFICSISISLLMNYLPSKDIGLEFVTFTGVLTAVIAGPLVAAIVAFILISFHMFITRTLGTYLLWVIPIYTGVAFASGFIHAPIDTVGTMATITKNVLMIFCTLLVMPGAVPKFLIWSITNILINIMLFNTFAPIILRLAA